MPRRLRLLLTCIGTALALAGALWLPTTKPTYEQKYRPLTTTGRVGQMITTRDFRIRVRQVVLANSLADGGQVIPTDSVWVVLVTDIGAEREVLDDPLEGGVIHTADGSEYRADAGLPSNTNPILSDDNDPVPLGPVKPQWFWFQIPRDRLTGATFEVTKDRITFVDNPSPWGEQWFLPGARIDLGFDNPRRTADALRHAVSRYPVPRTHY